MTTRQVAQRRVDQIRAFRAELADLEREQVWTVAPEDRARVASHQDALISALARDFDIDVGARERQLSVGMRLASAFGALALGASVFLFFYHYWTDLTLSAQVALGMALMARRTRYVTGVLGVMTIAAFVLNLDALGQIFNIVPSPHAFLAWGTFGAVLAYTCRLRWLLVISLGGLTVWVAGALLGWAGAPGWSSAFDHLETFLLPGVAILVMGGRLDDEEFAPAWRFAGWFVVFLSLLVLSVGDESLLPWSREAAQLAYQVVGLTVTAGAIAVAVRRHWGETVNLGALFFAAFLLTRLVDWWWDWMPSYLFFFLIGLLALGLIVLFRRLRHRMEGRA